MYSTIEVTIEDLLNNLSEDKRQALLAKIKQKQMEQSRHRDEYKGLLFILLALMIFNMLWQ